MAPPVDPASFCAALGERLQTTRKTRRMGRTLRLALVSFGVIALLAAASYGAVEGTRHLGGHSPVLVLTDQPTTTAGVSTNTTMTSATATTLPAPLPVSAWPYPDYTPVPEPVPSAQVRSLAELVVAHFPDLDFEIREASKRVFPDKTIIEFGLTPRGSTDTGVNATIFKTDEGIPEAEKDPSHAVDIPGASAAFLMERTKPGGSGLDSVQLIATMPDSTVVNCESHGAPRNRDALPPLDRAGIIEMVTYLVSVIASGQVTLPDLSISTSTTLAQAYLPQEVLGPCAETVGNAISSIAYGKESEFIARLVPEAQAQGSEIYAQERKALKESGMSAGDYSNIYSEVIVEWRNGAYLSDYGYFVQTKPPVPAEVDVWLRVDPEGRAAYGATLHDKTVRWFRLERQPNGKWLIVP